MIGQCAIIASAETAAHGRDAELHLLDGGHTLAIHGVIGAHIGQSVNGVHFGGAEGHRRKILHDDSIRITATTVRVPVFNAHSESINLEFEKDFDLDELRETLKNAPGVIVEDDPKNNIYPMAINAAGHDETYVGRIRRDESIPSGVNLWVVADNIRKGAASNAVQIAKKYIEYSEEQER